MENSLYYISLHATLITIGIFGQMAVLVYFCSIFFIACMFRTIHFRKATKARILAFWAVLLLLPLQSLMAQCAMCRAVVEQGGEEVAEGINSGIVYLMAFPYVIVAVAFYLLYRNWKRTSAAR